MPDEYSGINTVIAFIILYLTIVGLPWAIPVLSDIMRYFIFEFATIAIPAFGIMYFDFKGKIPIGQETRQKIGFWFSAGLMLFIAGVAFLMGIVLWEVVEIEGIQVVTYENMATLAFPIMGIAVILYDIHMTKNRERYIKRGKTKSLF